MEKGSSGFIESFLAAVDLFFVEISWLDTAMVGRGPLRQMPTDLGGFPDVSCLALARTLVSAIVGSDAGVGPLRVVCGLT